MLEKIISIGSKAPLPMASKALQSIDVGKIAKDVGNNVARKAVNTIFKKKPEALEPFLALAPSASATIQQMALRKFIEEGKRKRMAIGSGIVPIENLVLKRS